MVKYYLFHGSDNNGLQKFRYSRSENIMNLMGSNVLLLSQTK